MDLQDGQLADSAVSGAWGKVWYCLMEMGNTGGDWGVTADKGLGTRWRGQFRWCLTDHNCSSVIWMTTVSDLIEVTTATVLVTAILYISTPITRLLYAAEGIQFPGMLRLASTSFSIWSRSTWTHVSWTGWSIGVDLWLRGVLVNDSITIMRSELEELCSGRLVEGLSKTSLIRGIMIRTLLRMTWGLLFSGVTPAKEVTGGTLVRIGENIHLVSAGGVALYVWKRKRYLEFINKSISRLSQ